MNDTAESALFDWVLLEGRAERTVSAAEIAAAGGPAVEDIQRQIEAFGLPAPEPDQPAFTPEEAHGFREFKRLEDVWPQEVGIQASRVYGRLLSRIAQTELQLFRVYTVPRLRTDGRDRVATLKAIREAFEALLPLADPFLVGIHRRWVEHELAQEAVTTAETEGDLPGAVNVTFLFCDLKDFTAFAEASGDIAAVLAIERFTEVVTRERGDECRFTKALGDGFMLAYAEPAAAVRAAGRIMAAMRDPRQPRVHASVHSGGAIMREGDYFGGSVNVAARLLNLSHGDELLATQPVVNATGDEFAWEQAGRQRVRGVSSMLDVFRLSYS